MSAWNQQQSPFGQGTYDRVASSIYGSGTIARTNTFIRTIWAWMAGGLTLTAALAWGVGTNEQLFRMVAPMMMPLSLGLLGMVFFLAWRIEKMAPQTATMVFLGYAALNGVVLSTIFRVYQLPQIGGAFVATAGTFGAMSVYGLVTKRDLSEWRTFLMMGVFGIVIASIVNIFLASDALYWVVTYAGVLVFVGLTAYDTQKLMHLGNRIQGVDAGAIRKYAILGALTLYMDFINLFLFLLRFFGGRREN